MTTITVSAGRNMGDVPMDANTWGRLQAEIVLAVDISGHTILFRGTGHGEWEGTYEEAFTVVAMAREGADTAGLTDHLGWLAGYYGQDAIAITTGETVLAGMQHSASV